MFVKAIGFRIATQGSLFVKLSDTSISYSSLTAQSSTLFDTLISVIFPSHNAVYDKIPFSYFLKEGLGGEDIFLMFTEILRKISRLTEKYVVIEEHNNPKVDFDYLVKCWIADEIDKFSPLTTDFPEEGKVFAASAIVPICNRLIQHINMTLAVVSARVTQIIAHFAVELWRHQTFGTCDDNIMVDYWKNNPTMQGQMLPDSNSDKGKQYYEEMLKTSTIRKVTPQKYFAEKVYDHLGVRAAKLITRPNSPNLFKVFAKNEYKQGFGTYRFIEISEPFNSILSEGIFDNKYQDHTSINNAVSSMSVEGSLFTGVVHFNNTGNPGMGSQLKLSCYELCPFRVSLESGKKMEFFFQSIQLIHPYKQRKAPCEKEILFNTDFSGTEVIVDNISFDKLVSNQYTKVKFSKTDTKDLEDIKITFPSFSSPDNYTDETIKIPLYHLLCGERWKVYYTKSVISSYKCLTTEKKFDLFHLFKDKSIDVSNKIAVESQAFNAKQYSSQLEVDRNAVAVTMAILDEILFKAFSCRFLVKIFKKIMLP